MHRAGRPQMDHGLSLLLFCDFVSFIWPLPAPPVGPLAHPMFSAWKTHGKAEGQAEIWGLRWEGRCSLLVQLMTDEILVEEFRQHFDRVLEHVRGCAQEMQPPRPNKWGFFPTSAFSPLAGQGKTWEAVNLQVARHFEAWAVVSVRIQTYCKHLWELFQCGCTSMHWSPS